MDFARGLSITPSVLWRVENDTQNISGVLEKLIRATYINLVFAEQGESMKVDIIKILEQAAQLPRAPKRTIQINPVEWTGAALLPDARHACAYA